MVSKGESLLSPSAVKLYGREVIGLAINLDAAGQALGSNNFLRSQLSEPNARFARIYGFSYEGTYTALSRPALFLVHGPGESANNTTLRLNVARSGTKEGTKIVLSLPGEDGIVQEIELNVLDLSVSNNIAPTDNTGVAARSWEFSDDIRVWEYDRGDFSLRLNIESGPLDKILLGQAQSADELPYFRGKRNFIPGAGE